MLKLLQATLCFIFSTLSTGAQVSTDIYIFLKFYLSSIYKDFYDYILSLDTSEMLLFTVCSHSN